MTILVTGGTGFLGSYFTRYALEQGEEHVVVLEKYPDLGRIADVLDRVTVIEGDVGDFTTVQTAMADHDVDRVAHFAFILGSPTVGNMVPYVRVQADGTANVFEAARQQGVKRAIFCSSVAAYGTQTASRLTEDLIGTPTAPYGFFKIWAEALANHYTAQQGVEIATVRYGSTYGLGRAWRGSYNSGLFTPPSELHYMARLEQLARGEDVEMPNDEVTADFTYAGDAAQAAWLALTAPNLPHQLYNVCSAHGPVGEFRRAMQDLYPDREVVEIASERPTRAHLPMD